MPSAVENFKLDAQQLLDSMRSAEERLATRRLITKRLDAMVTSEIRPFRPGFWSLLTALTVCLLALGVANNGSTAGCLVPSDWAMEIARRPSNCSAMCEGLEVVPVEWNVTQERFLQLYAYTGRPVLVKNGTRGWRAHELFNYTFIRDMHDRNPSAYGGGPTVKVIDPFNVELATLKEALHMSEERRAKPFYFGWKNLNRGVFKELLKYHDRPYYLGPELEHPAADWFYIGTAARAALPHIDFFSRPSWQAQIAGRKRWLLEPPVECESVCRPLQVDIEPGDILNVDPNQWYHSTFVLDGTFSITLGSEYM